MIDARGRASSPLTCDLFFSIEKSLLYKRSIQYVTYSFCFNSFQFLWSLKKSWSSRTSDHGRQMCWDLTHIWPATIAVNYLPRGAMVHGPGEVAHAMWCEPRPDIVNAMSITCEQWGHASAFNRSCRNCFEAGNCINLMYEQGPEIQVHYNSTSVDDEMETFRRAPSSFRELKFAEILRRLCCFS